MALQSTYGTGNDFYVSKTTFWWAVGIFILLLAAISFAMSRDISRLSLRSHDTGVVTDSAAGAAATDTINPNGNINSNPTPNNGTNPNQQTPTPDVGQ
jgi:hypothetical protein